MFNNQSFEESSGYHCKSKPDIRGVMGSKHMIRCCSCCTGSCHSLRSEMKQLLSYLHQIDTDGELCIILMSLSDPFCAFLAPFATTMGRAQPGKFRLLIVCIKFVIHMPLHAARHTGAGWSHWSARNSAFMPHHVVPAMEYLSCGELWSAIQLAPMLGQARRDMRRIAGLARTPAEKEDTLRRGHTHKHTFSLQQDEVSGLCEVMPTPASFDSHLPDEGLPAYQSSVT